MTYAIGIQAFNNKPTLRSGHAVVIVSAISSDEALGKGGRIAERYYPHKEGWFDYSLVFRNTELITNDEDIPNLQSYQGQ
jgi:hypothetical protein